MHWDRCHIAWAAVVVSVLFGTGCTPDPAEVDRTVSGTVFAADGASKQFLSDRPFPEHGEPLAGASLEVRVCGADCAETAWTSVSESDETGWFRFHYESDEARENFEIRAVEEGYRPATFRTSMVPPLGEKKYTALTHQFLVFRLGGAE